MGVHLEEERAPVKTCRGESAWGRRGWCAHSMGIGRGIAEVRIRPQKPC